MKVAEDGRISGIAHEGRVLTALALATASRSCPLRVPEVLALDATGGWLALRRIEGAETLHAFHRRTGRLGTALARQIGRALGWLHRARLPEVDLGSAPRDGDFAELFTYLRPEVYANLSQGGIELIGSVQRHRQAAAALAAIAQAERHPADRRPLHGDVKPANILRLPGPRPRLVFVDWERAVPGDPARDLGTLLSEYLPGWLAPEPGVRPLRGESLRKFAAALLEAYRSERGPEDRPPPDFDLRVIRWAGLGMLLQVYGATHYEGTYDARARRLAACAADLLGQPRRWAREILGT